MIFVTVGLHTQPFDRLIRSVDELAEKHLIKEKVVIQTGYAAYKPKYCEWNRIYPYNKMEEYADEAHIIITHGGPSSFMMALGRGKIPIVVPRRAAYGEHINDHQMEFTEAFKQRMRNIIIVEDISELENTIIHYDDMALNMQKEVQLNNGKFCSQLEEIIRSLFE